jgi:hypothetical protein
VAVGDAADYLPMDCAQWRMPAKERYEGGFEVQTKGRVLVIGNKGDPVTPLASARNVSAGLVGSVVLEHGGYGVSLLFFFFFFFLLMFCACCFWAWVWN